MVDFSLGSGGDNNKFYVDNLGFIFPLDTADSTISGLCGDECQLTVVAETATEQATLYVNVIPAESTNFVGLTIGPADDPQDVLNSLNAKYASANDTWFRMVQFQPRLASAKTGWLRAIEDPVIVATAVNRAGNLQSKSAIDA